MTNNTPELMPCPFCKDGGNPILTNDVPDSEASSHDDRWFIYCQKCGVSIEHQDKRQEAVKVWNTRSTAEPKVSEHDIVCNADRSSPVGGASCSCLRRREPKVLEDAEQYLEVSGSVRADKECPATSSASKHLASPCGLGHHIRFVEHHGNAQLDGTTRGEYWRVNGKVFSHKPTEKEVEEEYAAKQPVIHHNMGERFTVLPEMHSKQPIVNDDALAEAIKYFKDDEYRETIDGSLDYLHFEERLDVIIYHASKNGAVEVTVDELLRDVGYRDNMFAEILTCIGQAYPEGVKIVDGGK